MSDRLIREAKYAVSLAWLGFLRELALTRYRDDPGPHILPLVLGLALYVGQYEGRPFTAHKLAQWLGIPRPTVIRRLAAMIKMGAVERRGKYYYLPEEWLDSQQAIGLVRQLTQIINSACALLSKMDIKDGGQSH
jgi:hypothetical protein